MLIEIKCEDEKSCARLAAAFVKLGAESGQPMKVVQTPGDDPCHYIVINPPAPIEYDAGHVITVRHQGEIKADIPLAPLNDQAPLYTRPTVETPKQEQLNAARDFCHYHYEGFPTLLATWREKGEQFFQKNH